MPRPAVASPNHCPVPALPLHKFSRVPASARQVPPGILRTIELEYTSRIRPIFEEKCFACHDPERSVPWYGRIPVPWFGNPVERDVVDGQRFADLVAPTIANEDDPWLGPQARIRAIRSVVEHRTMPPDLYAFVHRDSHLTDAERSLVVDWANESLGRLTTAEARIAESAPADVVAGRLLRNRCTRCHNERIPDGDGRVYPFNDLDRLREDEFLVGDPPDEGKLYEVVKKGKMPPKDRDEPLSQEERKRLLEWIEPPAPE